MRRKYPRRKFKRRTGFLYRGQYEICHAYEIGEGGIGIVTTSSFSEGDQLILAFYIPGKEFVIAKGRVCFVQPQGDVIKYGVEFINLDFTYSRAIRHYVAGKKEVETESKRAAA